MYHSFGRPQKLILLATVVVLVLVMLAVGFGGPAQPASSDDATRAVGDLGPPSVSPIQQIDRAPAAAPRGPPAS